MINSKAYKVFSQLNSEEKRWFRKWVSSPAHNHNTFIVKLLEQIEARETHTVLSLRKEKIYAGVFVGQPWSNAKFRNLLSDFLSVLNDFLACGEWKKNAFSADIALVRTYRNRQLDALALKMASETAARQPARMQGTAQDFMQNYQLQEELYLLSATQKRGVSLHLQEMNDSLYLYFMAQTLKNACIGYSNQTLTGKTFEVHLLPEILREIATGKFDDILLVQFYYHAYSALVEDSAAMHYHKLKALLPQARSLISASELRDILMLALNYCIRKLNKGEADFAAEIFGLYRFGLDSEVLISSGRMDRFTFKNIITLALRLEELEWAQHFLETYAPMLDQTFRKPYEDFCRARLEYALGAHDKAALRLRDLTFDDVFLNLDARVLLAKIWFEQSEFRVLGPFLAAFDQFLKRQKKIDYHRANYQNIIYGFSVLLQWKNGGSDPEKGVQLRRQIETLAPLAEKEWILKQI